MDDHRHGRASPQNEPRPPNDTTTNERRSYSSSGPFGSGLDGVREVSEESRRLLAALEEVREAEAEKRREPVSSPRFHELANLVEAKAREVFGLAAQQRQSGEETPPVPLSIEDVEGMSAVNGRMPDDETYANGEEPELDGPRH
jgi:hypothetical protein